MWFLRQMIKVKLADKLWNDNLLQMVIRSWKKINEIKTVQWVSVVGPIERIG